MTKYNNWKLMEKLDVAVRQTDKGGGRYDFTGYVVEHGDESALASAKDWAKIRNYGRSEDIPPVVHTFDNGGFTATILDSAGGSSQGGRLSFWRCKVEKDGIDFTIGVNDAILADLIKNSEIKNGLVTEKVMFARKGGQPGLIHEGMQAYEDAVADMKHKADMKSMKKTSKWEIGGIYSSITKTDVCIGEVYDTLEEYTVEVETGYWGGRRTEKKLREAKTPKKVLAWIEIYGWRYKEGVPDTFEKVLQTELGHDYAYFSAGKPPSRAKTDQMEVKESDLALIDKMLKKRKDYLNQYNGPEISGRYVRKLKNS